MDNDKESKFKIDEYVKKWKYKNIFVKGYISNWSEELSLIRKLVTWCCGYILLVILMVKKLLERFSKNNGKN